MNRSEETKILVMKYFNSWQEPSDFKEMRECLSENFYLDAGIFNFSSADDFVKISEENGSPWKDVKLLESIFYENKAAIIYEGAEKKSDSIFRVSEFIEVNDGKIQKILSNITPL